MLLRVVATFLKKPLKHSKSVVFFGGRERFAGQQVAAGMIGDGQRVAIVIIPQQELALEIGAPEFIRVLAEGEIGAVRTATHPAAALCWAMSMLHGVDSALGREEDAGEAAPETLANLAGTPARVLALHIQDEVLHLEGKLVGVVKWPPTSVGQPLKWSVLCV